LTGPEFLRHGAVDDDNAGRIRPILAGNVAALPDLRTDCREESGRDVVFFSKGILIGCARGLPVISEVAIGVGAGERRVDAASHGGDAGQRCELVGKQVPEAELVVCFGVLGRGKQHSHHHRVARIDAGIDVQQRDKAHGHVERAHHKQH